MCELEWYALAEIHLNNQDLSQEVYCLCSRVLLRSKDDNLKYSISSAEISASEEEQLPGEDETTELPNLLKIKKDEHETLSCYCSASHTDNLSTDEHDSLRDSHPENSGKYLLKSSDSGTDLTELNKQDIEFDWQRYWAQNGEKIIWESWIAKYSAYINPEYLEQAQTQIIINENEQPTTSSGSVGCYPLERRELLTLNIEPHKSNILPSSSRILLRNLSGSDDKLNTEVSEGWNPLSPLSVECETDVEQLLSSRCASHASSSARTIDSMTNVTRMTISSIDLSHSSPSPDSFSSVSSVPSSLSSSNNSDGDNDEDYQNQWNVLWRKHYENEFLINYQKFFDQWKQQQQQYFNVFQGKFNGVDLKHPINVSEEIANSLGNILNSLTMTSEENTLNKPDDSDCDPQLTLEEDNDIDNEQDVEQQMVAMGLPSAFGSKKQKVDDESAIINKKAINEDFDSLRSRIKAAFNLIGIEYHERKDRPALSGQVQYKMKHIRLQNRHLKLLSNIPKPRHMYFDDDGNVLPTTENNPTNFIEEEEDEADDNDDDDDDGDEEEEEKEEVLPETTVKISSEDDETFPKGDTTTSTKRKRRMKKRNLPPEIKENSHLMKYWRKRFYLFSKFDEGIKLDEESWYSVTPELIAKHIAERCRCDVIIDGFCGAGGNSIQFAFTCKKVIAIDIDPKKIELAKHNAEIYGVADRIEFIIGDFFNLVNKLKADVVFFSPPWGGPKYLNEIVYDLETMLLPVPIAKLLEEGRKITQNIAVFLPKNSNAFLLIDHTKPGGGVEIEQNFLNKYLTSITAYYNDLIKKKFLTN